MPQKQQKSLTPTTTQCHWLMERLSSDSPSTLVQQTRAEALGHSPLLCAKGTHRSVTERHQRGVLESKEETQVGQRYDTEPQLNPCSPRQARDMVAPRMRPCQLPARKCQLTMTWQGMEGPVGIRQSSAQGSSLDLQAS